MGLIKLLSPLKLVSQSVLDKVNCGVALSHNRPLQIIEMIGKREPSLGVISLRLQAEDTVLLKQIVYAAVTNSTIPYCLLLGTDFIISNVIINDVARDVCGFGGGVNVRFNASTGATSRNYVESCTFLPFELVRQDDWLFRFDSLVDRSEHTTGNQSAYNFKEIC